MRALLGACVAAALLAGCSSGAPHPNAPSSAGASSAGGSSAGGGSGAGATQTLNDGMGDTVQVTLLKVTYPAAPAAHADAAPPGDALVGVFIKVVGATGTYTGDAEIDVAVVASNGHTFAAGAEALAGCPRFKTGNFTLTGGKALSGCVAVPIKRPARPTTIEYDAGTIGSTGKWGA